MSGVDVLNCSCATSDAALEPSKSRVGLVSGSLVPKASGGGGDGNSVLAEFDHPKVVAARHPFIAAAVEQRHQVHAGGGRLGVGRGVGKSHFGAAGGLSLHEYIVQHALLVDPFSVEYCVSAAERAETAGVELAELRLFESRLAQYLGLLVGHGHLEKHQPGQPQGDHRGKAEQRGQQPGRPEAAGLQGGHLAVMIQTAQGQHDGQQQAHRHDHRQIHDRAERDQFEHHPPAVLVVRSLTQHPRQLIRHQNRDQDAGHRRPGLRDLAQYISLHRPFSWRRA